MSHNEFRESLKHIISIDTKNIKALEEEKENMY